jgi:hypothetical protein
LLACLLLGLCAGSAQAETAGRVFLMNGQVVPGWVQEVTDEGLAFKTSGGRVGEIPLENVREMRLRLPPAFQSAVEQLGGHSAEEAIRILEGYADQSDPENYYPVPGNLASRASYELTRYYRAHGQAEQAGKWALAYDPDLLPQAAPVPWLKLYRKLATTPDDDFFAEARTHRDSADLAGRAEIDFLIAVAHELRGELSEALAAHGRAYSPSGSLLNPFGEKSLDRSIEILRNLTVPGISQPESLLEGLLEIRERLYGWTTLPGLDTASSELLIWRTA